MLEIEDARLSKKRELSSVQMIEIWWPLGVTERGDFMAPCGCANPVVEWPPACMGPGTASQRIHLFPYTTWFSGHYP